MTLENIRIVGVHIGKLFKRLSWRFGHQFLRLTANKESQFETHAKYWDFWVIFSYENRGFEIRINFRKAVCIKRV